MMTTKYGWLDYNWFERRRARKQCFHHKPPTIAGEPAGSFIRHQLIETGKAKMFWCSEILGGCGQTWVN
jgi:hypothetical protein